MQIILCKDTQGEREGERDVVIDTRTEGAPCSWNALSHKIDGKRWGYYWKTASVQGAN